MSTICVNTYIYIYMKSGADFTDVCCVCVSNVSDDYFRMYAPKCGGCGKPITTSFITAVHQNWHLDCFVCFVSIGVLCMMLILNHVHRLFENV